jgi:hypothetical protein
MKENTHYFDHDYNAQNDPKVEKMLCEKGNSAYGVFWRLIERLAQEPIHKLKTEYKILAYRFHETVEFVKSVVEDFDLFIVSEGYFWSERLLKHFEKRSVLSEKGRIGGLKRVANLKGGLKGGLPNGSSILKESKEKEIEIKEKEILNKENIGDKSPATKQVKSKINNFKAFNEDQFKISLEQYANDFPSSLISDFFDYWSEPDSNGKMRFQKQDTWELKRRLTKWQKNSEGKTAQVMNGKPQGKKFLSAQEKARNAMYESTLTVIGKEPRKTIAEEREEYFQKKILESITEPLQLGNKTN